MSHRRIGDTKAKVERANGVIGDTLRAHAIGSNDDWDRQALLAESGINSIVDSRRWRSFRVDVPQI